MRRAALFTLCLIVTLPLFAEKRKATEMDLALAKIEAATKPSEAKAPMEYILAHSKEAPAIQLLLAAAIAINIDRLEDGAYLFYAGQMRARYDLVRFPPKAKGADSPGVALGAITNQLGAEINPAVMRVPPTFAKVVTRVGSWSPEVPAGYDPGWEYGVAAEGDAKRAFTEHHDGFVKQFGGLSKLLSNAEYFAAFKTLQGYNLSPMAEQKKPERMKEQKAAESKMLELEKKLGIEGLFYRKSGA